MSSPPDPLGQLLHLLGSEGIRADEGSFSLDPTRAAELLRQQGQLGRNAPLYLLAAIHAHTDGASITHQRGLRSHTLHWEKDAPLPLSMERTLAEASFAAHGLELLYLPQGVTFRSTSGRLGLTSSLLSTLFQEVEDRLERYPWSHSPRDPRPILAQDATFTLYPSRQQPQFLHVIRGITYARSWSGPVDAVCFDPQGRPDLSLTTVPDSNRTHQLEGAAERLLLDRLERDLTGASACCLSPTRVTSNLPLFAEHLAYLSRQTLRPDLASTAGDLVLFRDATERRWSASDLLREYQQHGRMMVIDNTPEGTSDSANARADRPVLLWGGDSERIGGQLFPNLAPGAGYLHSLTVNEIERQRQGETPLAELPVEDGRLSLLPWGDPDRIAEVEFVGPRRARETFYLENEAPRGLRLLWESESSLEESLRELALPAALRQTVIELLDASLIHHTPDDETLFRALAWALSQGPLQWSRLSRLCNVPLFEDVRGRRVALASLLQRSEPLPTLADRSCSLPKRLPTSTILWWHPLFEPLAIRTEEWGRAVREASWQEEGRERWLAAHDPREPDQPDATRVGSHFLSRLPDARSPSEVIFWREGRPFGRRQLSASDGPPGFRLIWVQDDLPGDTYWSGPEAEALSERWPEIVRILQDAQKEAAPPG